MPMQNGLTERPVVPPHELLVPVNRPFRHQEGGVEAEVPGLAGIQAHRFLEVLAGEHGVVGDLGTGTRREPGPLGEPPDVQPADVGGGDGVVGIRQVGGLERRQRLGDPVVGAGVQRLPEQLVGPHRIGRALGARAFLGRGPDGHGAAPGREHHGREDRGSEQRRQDVRAPARP